MFVQSRQKADGDVYGIDKLKNALHNMKLSTLQSKIKKTDMLSLYKSLTERIKPAVKPQPIQGWKSIHYPEPKQSALKKNSETLQEPIGTLGNLKPLTLDFEKIKGHLKSPKVPTGYETFWTKQHPIAKPDSQILEESDNAEINDLTQVQFLKQNQKLLTPDIIGSYIYGSIKQPGTQHLPSEPAGIEKVEYEPIYHPSITFNHEKEIHEAETHHKRISSLHGLGNMFKEPGRGDFHDTKQQLEAKGSLLSEKEIINPSLAKYYTSTNLQPNGVPIYEDKKDKTPSHPKNIE